MQDKIWTYNESDSLKLRDFYNKNSTSYESFESDKGKIIGVFPAENGDIRDLSENHFLSNFKAKHTINAENKIISPGFIDVHTHDDDNVFLDPSMSSKISQGVTTCVAGNCGISLAPFSYKGEVPAPIALLGKSEVFRFPRVVIIRKSLIINQVL